MPFCAQAAFQWTIKYLATHLTGTFPSETIACKDICKYTHSVLVHLKHHFNSCQDLTSLVTHMQGLTLPAARLSSCYT